MWGADYRYVRVVRRSAVVWRAGIRGRYCTTWRYQRRAGRYRLARGDGTAITRARASTSPSARAIMARRGAGKPNDTLAGGAGCLSGDRPLKTVGSYWPYATTLFDYVRRAMPWDHPKSLTDDEVYAVSAYILFLNDLVGRDDVLDARSLPAIKMPNRDRSLRPISAAIRAAGEQTANRRRRSPCRKPQRRRDKPAALVLKRRACAGLRSAGSRARSGYRR